MEALFFLALSQISCCRIMVIIDNLRKFKKTSTLKSIIILIILILAFFYPVWLQGKIPLNGNFLVSFYVPWKYSKFAGFPTGVPAKQGGGYDTLRIGYPYFGMVHEGWRNGYVPLWNPYNFAGLPLAAETQSAAFYPLQFLSIFLSQVNLWIIFTVSGYFFCFLFTYLYLKNLTSNFFASIFGSFTFAFNTFFIAWNQEVVTAIHAAMWLPLMLLAVDNIFDQQKTLRWWFILFFGAVLSILSGYVQVTLYVFLVTGLYLIWRFLFSFFKETANTSLKPFFLGFSAMIAATSVTLFQTLPLYEMYRLSSRPLIDMKEFLVDYLMPLYAPIQLIIPSFFGNSGTWNHYGFTAGTFYEHTFTVSLVAVIFALFALLAGTSRDKFFFLIIGIISLLFTLDVPISRLIFDFDIPVLSSSIANRLLFIPPFSLAVLSAYGIKIWQETEFRKIKVSLIFCLAIITAIFLAILAWVLWSRIHGIIPTGFPNQWTTIALRNSVVPGGILLSSILLLTLAAMIKKIKKAVAIALFLLAVFQIGYFFQKVTAFSPREFIYPSHPLFEFLKQQASPYRFLGFAGAFIDNNIATQMHVFSPEGYDSLANRRYAQLLKASETGGVWTDQLSRSDVGISKVIDKSFAANKQRSRILELTSTKYILYKPLEGESSSEIGTNADAIFADHFKFVKEIDGIRIYENQQVMPRALLIARQYVARSNQEIFDRLFQPQFNPKEELILERQVEFEPAKDPEAKVSLELYQPNKVVLKTKSKTPQWLLLTDSYYPGWHAFIDGIKAEIYRANFAFRAVPVPAGEHTVEFIYWPKSFDTGIKVSLLTALVIGLIILFIRRQAIGEKVKIR